MGRMRAHGVHGGHEGHGGPTPVVKKRGTLGAISDPLLLNPVTEPCAVGSYNPCVGVVEALRQKPKIRDEVGLYCCNVCLLATILIGCTNNFCLLITDSYPAPHHHAQHALGYP